VGVAESDDGGAFVGEQGVPEFPVLLPRRADTRAVWFAGSPVRIPA